ncbi:MAG: RecX family transcriptional regulator [Clostridia bacterium]|nr:RecX family transcriptional regulator [Clostridia bacterium]
MKVTAIKPDKKHLTKLLLDEDSEIFIDNDVFCESGITIGSHITEEELKKLKYESDLRRAKSRALWYLDRMDYTEKALYEKLIKAGFGKRASAAVIARFCELGVIDDRRYAERLAERLKETNVSKREAMHKMLLKGLSYDLIKEILDSDETDEEEKIKNLLEGKYARKLTEEKGAEKVYAALVRKGFSYGAVRTAMKNYTEQLEFCED